MEELNNIKEIIEFPVTPITEETFERQGWEKYEDEYKDQVTGEISKFHYFVLPLPKDNPEDDCMTLISSANDEWEDVDNLIKGEYVVELSESYGLGLCWTEEEIEILYKALTTINIE